MCYSAGVERVLKKDVTFLSNQRCVIDDLVNLDLLDDVVIVNRARSFYWPHRLLSVVCMHAACSHMLPTSFELLTIKRSIQINDVPFSLTIL